MPPHAEKDLDIIRMKVGCPHCHKKVKLSVTVHHDDDEDEIYTSDGHGKRIAVEPIENNCSETPADKIPFEDNGISKDNEFVDNQTSEVETQRTPNKNSIEFKKEEPEQPEPDIIEIKEEPDDDDSYLANQQINFSEIQEQINDPSQISEVVFPEGQDVFGSLTTGGGMLSRAQPTSFNRPMPQQRVRQMPQLSNMRSKTMPRHSFHRRNFQSSNRSLGMRSGLNRQQNSRQHFRSQSETFSSAEIDPNSAGMMQMNTERVPPMHLDPGPSGSEQESSDMSGMEIEMSAMEMDPNLAEGGADAVGGAAAGSAPPKGWESTCKLCNKAYKQRCHMLQHYRIVHLNELPFQCDYCGRKFGTKNEHLLHIAQKGVSCMKYLRKVSKKAQKEVLDRIKSSF